MSGTTSVNSEAPEYGGVAEAFRLADSARISVRGLQKATLNVTEIRNDRTDFGQTDPLPYLDGIMLGLQLKPLRKHELWFDGQAMDVVGVTRGDTIFYDMRRNPIAHVTEKSHSLHFILTRSFLEELAADLEGAAFREIEAPSGVPQRDRVLLNLQRAILPFLAAPGAVSELFASHLVLALGLYVGTTYGGLRAGSGTNGGLDLAQQRLAMEVMRANLNGEVDLQTLAGTCHLTGSRFMRAFRTSFGMAPFQWLERERLRLACGLLRGRRIAVTDVARLCGYADNRHFSRVFRATFGATPTQFRIGSE